MIGKVEITMNDIKMIRSLILRIFFALLVGFLVADRIGLPLAIYAQTLVKRSDLGSSLLGLVLSISALFLTVYGFLGVFLGVVDKCPHCGRTMILPGLIKKAICFSCKKPLVVTKRQFTGLN